MSDLTKDMMAIKIMNHILDMVSSKPESVNINAECSTKSNGKIEYYLRGVKVPHPKGYICLDIEYSYSYDYVALRFKINTFSREEHFDIKFYRSDRIFSIQNWLRKFNFTWRKYRKLENALIKYISNKNAVDKEIEERRKLKNVEIAYYDLLDDKIDNILLQNENNN